MNLHDTAIGTRLLTATSATLVVIASCLAGSALAAEGVLNVYMSHARILKLDRPVSKVIVGNAQVADATVADAQMIVLTGRSFGTTNLVILDADGNPLVDERILVSTDETNTMRVFRQTDRSVLSCAPVCEVPAPIINATIAPRP